MALCICTGTYGAASGPKGRTRRRCEEPQWRAGCESDSAFRRGKEGAGTHYARQLDRAAGVADEWRVAAGPGRLAGRLRAACCVPCLREMSRQRARGGHVAACGHELGEHAAYARPDLASWALKQTPLVLLRYRRMLPNVTWISLRTHISVLLPCFRPAASCVHHIHTT